MRKDASPDRTFVNLIPFFVLLLAWVINGVVILFPGKKIRSLLLIFVAGYCFVNLSQQLNKVSDHLLNDILTSGRSHNLYYNYYLAHFRPLNVVKKFKESVYHDGDFVVIRDAEPHDLPEYLTKYNIPVHDFSLTDSVLRSGKKVFLFSRYPNEIVNDSFGKQHQCNVKLISEGLTYHNLFELERKAGTEANQ